MINTLNPKIRFTQADATNYGDWEQRKLGEYTEIVKRVNNDSTAPVRMISAGNGFILQSEKYSRDNAGQSLKKYIELHRGELAYNHGYSKAKKYGSCFMLEESDMARVPFVYHCFRITNGNPKFFAIMLNRTELNSELVKYISSTARMDGLLNIPYDDYMSIEVRVPQSEDEQAKIADFLSRLDNTIALHQRKIDVLRRYKAGLLQKMFPKNGETVPEVRFPGFTGEWEQRKVRDVAEIVAGGTPSTSKAEYWNPKEVPWLSSGEVHKKYVTFTDNMISQEGLNNSSAKIIKEDSVLIALAGQGKTRGTVAINRIPLSTNQSVAAMTFQCDIVPEFVFSNLSGRYDEIRKMSSGDGARGGLNKQLVGDITIPYTSIEEQTKIGSLFMYLDDTIALHQRKLETMKKYKAGLLQQMFC